MTGREIDEAVATLKLVCDPRGWAVLDALASMARVAVELADEIEGHRVYWDDGDHSRKVTHGEAA